MSHDIFGAYDTNICSKAVVNLWLAPTELTDEEIGQLSIVDAAIGDQARQRQQGLKDKDDLDDRKVSGSPVTFKYFVKFLRYFLIPLLATYRYKVKALEAKVLAQDKRLSEIETKSMLFQGVWESGRPYGAGSVVTRSGSSWHTKRATCGTPGGPEEGDRDWVLMVKKGCDGKDARW
jgi:hypothetical protein